MIASATHPAARDARTAGAAALAQALRATRERTLGLLAAWQQALPGLRVPYAGELNPPLWELGHVGWFQEWWIARNRERALGVGCNPGHARPASHLPGADALFNSSEVPHLTRWDLPLPDLDALLRYLAQVQADTLALLQEAGGGADPGDDALYFWRLVLFHEQMHNEASVYMAQALDVAIPEALARGHAAGASRSGELQVPAQTVQTGHTGTGFAFDNELAAHAVDVPAFRIDAAPVTWARYLPFIGATGHALPLHVRSQGGQWQQRHFGRWLPLDLNAPAVHLSWHDAQAWCRWAGRRLPTEAQWECAARMHGQAMAWGEVWEWTASAFEPYPGFVAHPYRDYSAPWFGNSRYVLRGGCAATDVQMLHVAYRNYFTPERRDIFAGFRSIA